MRVQLHTYLNYGGNCEEAFRFYEQHLDGKITMMMRHGEQPDTPGVPRDQYPGVLHARMNIGGTELLGADIPAERFQPISSAYLSLTFDSDQETDRVFALLSEGGQTFMPIQETFFASGFDAMTDDLATAVSAGRRQRVNRAFEAVERLGLSRHRDLKGFVVIVATHAAFRHCGPRSRSSPHSTCARSAMHYASCCRFTS